MAPVKIVAIIPALDEEGAIAEVVRGIAAHVSDVVVVDNGSSDRTASVAEDAGAIVVREPRRGYGRACLAGIAQARMRGAEIVLFADGDGSDDPDDAPRLIEAVTSKRADLALGERLDVEPGAMTTTQRFGNWLAPLLMRRVLGSPYRDMPPFKAISVEALERLDLGDIGHGFTIELLIKAHQRGLRVQRLSVRCRARRAGESKVSGTLIGSARAAAKIITTIARYAPSSRGS